MLNSSNADIAARLDSYLTSGINSIEKETEFVKQTLIPCLSMYDKLIYKDETDSKGRPTFH